MRNVLLVITAVGVRAWTPEIHRKIGAVAMKLIDKKPGLARTIRFMLGGELEQFVGYGHEHYNEKYKFTRKLHFQPSQAWSCTLGKANDLPKTKEEFAENYSPCDHGHENHCLLGAMYYIFGRFAHDELTAYKGMVIPPVTKLLDVKRGLPHQFDDMKLIRWLMTLVADLHEPMHLGFSSDEYGQDITVTYLHTKYTLYEFWDKEVGKMFADYDSVETLEEKGYTSPMSFFGHWGEESAKLACDQIYSKLAERGAKVPDTFEITKEIYDEWVELARVQILKAGERTALLLENIVEHRKVHKLEEEGRQYHFGVQRQRSAAMTNLGIATVFFPLWCLFQRWLDSISTKRVAAI